MELDFKEKNLWIYGFGVAGKWASDNLNSRIKGFIDSGSAKWNLKYKNLSVFSPEKAESEVLSDDHILITVLDIQDVVPIISRKFNNVKWSALGQFIKNQKKIVHLLFFYT